MGELSYYVCKKCGTIWRYKSRSGFCDCGNHIDLNNCQLKMESELRKK